MSRPTRRSLRESQQPRRRSAPVRLLLGAAGVAGAVILGIVAGGGTYAAWSAAAPTASAVTLTAGSAGLAVTGAGPAATGLYPGRTLYGVATVRNTGTTPLAVTLDTVTATTSPFTAALVVTAGAARSAADCTAGRVTPTVTTTVGASPRAALTSTLVPGASALVCIGVGLPTTAPAAAAGAAASPLTLLISGTQVRP